MPLSVRNDPRRPSGGSVILEGPALGGVSGLTIENVYSGLFLGPDGRWGKQPHAFAVAATGDPATLSLGPEIVDCIPAELQLALRTGEGRDLGRLFWVDIAPSRSKTDEAPPEEPPPPPPPPPPPSPPTNLTGGGAAPVEPTEGKPTGGWKRAALVGVPAALLLLLGTATAVHLRTQVPPPTPVPTPAPVSTPAPAAAPVAAVPAAVPQPVAAAPTPQPPAAPEPPPPRPLSDLERRASAAAVNFFHRHDYRQGDSFAGLVSLYPPQFQVRHTPVALVAYLKMLGTWDAGFHSVQFQVESETLDLSGCARPEDCLVRGTFKEQALRAGSSHYDMREAPFAVRFNLVTGLVLSECNVPGQSEAQEPCE